MIFILFFCIYLWYGFFSYVFPWTQTFFLKHETFIELLNDRNCFCGRAFEEKIPDGSGKVKYYWHQEAKEILAAYSVTLSDEEYEKITEKRLNAHCDEMKKWNLTPTYVLQNEEYCYIEDTGWYDEEKLHFVDRLFEKPKHDKQYYFLIFTEYSVFDSVYYSGVILNDTTHELVEFSVRLRSDVTPCVRRMFWEYNSFVVETYQTSYYEEMLSSFHNPAYFVYKGTQIYKSGYRVAFSAEDYALVKKERMEYYQTALFECKYADDYVGERYVCSDGEKQYLNSVNLEDKRIDYLDALLTEEEKGKFYLGCSRFKDHEKNYYYQYYRYDAVLFNDETCEMIEISYFGPRELEEEDELTVFEMAIGVLLLIREFFFEVLWI